MSWLAWAAAIASGLFALDRLCLWMEARGWLYYRKVKRKTGAISAVIQGLEASVNPAAQYVEEAREQHAEEEDDGDDDGDRAPQDRIT